jgi:C4-dicarboxylate-specific signal transduction histidine kinase
MRSLSLKSARGEFAIAGRPSTAPDSIPGQGIREGLAYSWIRRYGTAVLFVALALGAEKLLQHFFPYPFLLFFFAAVIASAWNGGAGPGLFAVVISILAVDYFFIPPLDSLVINAAAATYCAAFIVSALLASWVSATKKGGESALREARDQLELRVDERTAELQLSNAELRDRERQLQISNDELRQREHQLQLSNAELRDREHQLQLLIEERERAEQALMKTQTELAHLSRVLTIGELTTSIAHEVTQPLTAVVINGDACLECLSSDPPNLDEARQAAEKIVEDGTRAGSVLGRIRALFKKETLSKDWIDLNEVVQELAVLLRDEAIRQRVSIEADLAPDLPRVMGDRVQLQQVVLNLLMNGMDATCHTADRPRQLRIVSGLGEFRKVFVAVEDNGVGLDAEIAERIFEPFYTTKPQGIGMGLSISRSIVESHGGRLWASPGRSGGAVFQFTIPIESSNRDA